MKTWKEMFSDLFSSPPVITEGSSIHEIATHYPNLHAFVERKYGIKIDTEDNSLSLQEFTEKHGLPPSQILFMEVQLESRVEKIREIPAPEVQRKIETFKILDAREAWEQKFGSLPNSRPLDSVLLDEILNEWKKDTPIVVYCHFGVRSMDAAIFLADRGFTNVSVLKGGIDAWSQSVDPKVARYHGQYC